MSDTIQDMRSALLVDEGRLTNQLINHLLVITLLIMTMGMVFIQLRAEEFARGWRDWVQLVTYLVLVGFTLGRNRISLKHKLNMLIAFMLINGSAGMYTLGLFGSAIFFFALVSIFAAMFYQLKTLVMVMLLSGTVVVIAALSFIYGYSVLDHVENLLSSPLIWTVYLVGFFYMMVVVSYAVYRYRSAHDYLLQMVSKQRDELGERTEALEKAMQEIETLQGIIPICSYCHNIHNEEGAWDQLEVYISKHSNAKFSHGVCPDCLEKITRDEM